MPGSRGPRQGQLATQIGDDSTKSITTVLEVFKALRSSTLAELEKVERSQNEAPTQVCTVTSSSAEREAKDVGLPQCVDSVISWVSKRLRHVSACQAMKTMSLQLRSYGCWLVTALGRPAGQHFVASFADFRSQTFRTFLTMCLPSKDILGCVTVGWC